MAIGFTPKNIQDFPLGNLTQEQFIVLSNETVKNMGWEVNYISENGLIAYTNKGMFSWNAEIRIKIENGIANIQSASTGNEMMDWGKNKRTVNRFISNLETLKTQLSEAELETKFQELREQLVPKEEDVLTLPPATTTENIKSFFSIFVPSKSFFVTPILIDLNIIIFILMVCNGVNIMQPSSESLLAWGANFRPLTLAGEWWRLITNCFLHIGILHLLLNMYALLYIGVLLEPHLGRTRFAAAYLLTGLIASLTSLWWHSLTVSAGASGAIFGMYGVFLAMLTTNLIEKTARKELLASIAVFVVYNLVFGLKGGIDNAAHIGGLISGIVIGYAFIPSLKKPEQNGLKFGTIGLLTILMVASSFIVYKKIPNDIGIYDAKMKEFAAMESMALEVYKLPPDSPNEKILDEIKNRGLYYWNEDLKLVNSFDKMDLPDEIKTRNGLLKEYIELRIKSYELLYKAVSENTNQYDPQLEAYNKQIETKINKIGGEQ